MGRAPLIDLCACGRTLPLGQRPWLMGVLNATPDSFSDGDVDRSLPGRVARAARMLAEGADIIDIGGESAITGVPPVPAAEEAGRVVELVRRVAGDLGALVSIDTYKPAVAEAAIEAGAVMVNDVSGLADPDLAGVCARTGAALVLMHTRAPPKQRLQDTDRYDDVAADVRSFLAQRIEVALERGVQRSQIVVDPGPDFAKTPAQTLTALRELARLHELGRPVLLAASRKDFIGALTSRRPSERLAGTLAVVGHGVGAGVHLLRVHDVAPTADYLAVSCALAGGAEVAEDLRLPDALRREIPRPRA